MSADRVNALKALETWFEKDQEIFREGESSRELYILIEGAVDVRKGDKTIATVSESGAYLGEMSTLLGLPRTATCVAGKRCRMIRVPERRVPDFFAHSPAMAIKLAKVLAQRLHEMNSKYEALLRDGVGEADAKDCRVAFRRLTNNPYNRRFMDIYCQHVGQTLPAKEVMAALRYPIKEVNMIFETYSKAGLIEIKQGAIEFKAAPDMAMQQLILNWKPSTE